jgi:hypothetical protein
MADMKKSLLFVLTLYTQLALAQTPPLSTPIPEATLPGMELTDTNRGLKVVTPNALWNINASKFSISLSHSTYYDVYVVIKKSSFNVATAQDAYQKHRDYLKTYLPDAGFLKENEGVTVGNTQGLSMTYLNPGEKKVFREIAFIHRGVPYEISFSVKEENFEAVKEDFTFILQHLQMI